MSDHTLTLTDRQVRALFAIARMEATIGGRFPVPEDGEERRYRPSEVPPVTDESHLTAKEMRDLHIRLHYFLFPVEIPDHEIEVRVKS